MFDWFEKTRPDQDRAADFGDVPGDVLITGQAGLLAGTSVASNLGWTRVERLSVGDKVLTFDHGMQMVSDIQRDTIHAGDMMLSGAERPLQVPAGALHNQDTLLLMPDQGLMIESEDVSDPNGDPFAVIPARALNGVWGIGPADPMARLDITILSFLQDDVVYLKGGVMAYCPRPRTILTDLPTRSETEYTVLDPFTAHSIVEDMLDADCFAVGLHEAAKDD